MKKAMMFVLVTLFLAGISFAQSTSETTVQQDQQSGDTSIQIKQNATVGTIKKVDVAGKTITIVSLDDPNKVTVYTIDDKTALTSSGKTIEIGDLKEGEKVTFESNDTNTLVTLKVGDTEMKVEPEKK
jgi:Cu/Ag efflux protein CusF